MWILILVLLILFIGQKYFSHKPRPGKTPLIIITTLKRMRNKSQEMRSILNQMGKPEYFTQADADSITHSNVATILGNAKTYLTDLIQIVEPLINEAELASTTDEVLSFMGTLTVKNEELIAIIPIINNAIKKATFIINTKVSAEEYYRLRDEITDLVNESNSIYYNDLGNLEMDLADLIQFYNELTEKANADAVAALFGEGAWVIGLSSTGPVSCSLSDFPSVWNGCQNDVNCAGVAMKNNCWYRFSADPTKGDYTTYGKLYETMWKNMPILRTSTATDLSSAKQECITSFNPETNLYDCYGVGDTGNTDGTPRYDLLGMPTTPTDGVNISSKYPLGVIHKGRWGSDNVSNVWTSSHTGSV